MLLFAIALLQAGAPAQTTAAAEPSTVSAPQPTEGAAEPAPPEPKMKRVCRKVMDPRVSTLASRQTVCKFVPLDEDKSPHQ
jgi:hypothetical protein